MVQNNSWDLQNNVHRMSCGLLSSAVVCTSSMDGGLRIAEAPNRTMTIEANSLLAAATDGSIGNG